MSIHISILILKNNDTVNFLMKHSLISKGVKQRVHKIKVMGNDVYVNVDRSNNCVKSSSISSIGDVESDRYASLASMMDIPVGSLTIDKVEAGRADKSSIYKSYPIHSSYKS